MWRIYIERPVVWEDQDEDGVPGGEKAEKKNVPHPHDKKRVVLRRITSPILVSNTSVWPIQNQDQDGEWSRHLK